MGRRAGILFLLHTTCQYQYSNMGASKSSLSKTSSQVARTFPTKPSPNVRFQAPPTQLHEAPQSDITTPTTTSTYHHLPLFSHQLNLAVKQPTQFDPRDPAFAKRLHSLGVVPPNPFQPLTSQSADPHSPPPRSIPGNNAMQSFKARERLEKAYAVEQEDLARPGFAGRKFLEASRIADALRLRASGMSDAEVEEKLGIGRGGLAVLGRKGVVDVIT